jgi:hypothetical protein
MRYDAYRSELSLEETMNKCILLALAATALTSACTMQGQNQAGPQTASATIPFVDFGSLEGWQEDSFMGVYLEANGGKWYHASFMSPCREIQGADRIAVRSMPGNTLDRFGSIEVRGEICQFNSLERIPGRPGGQPQPVQPQA